MGEGIGPNNGLDIDTALMQYVSSVNIACGFHAGSPSIMHDTIRAAVRHGLAIGAHPGFPDKENFGRNPLPLIPEEIYQITLYQIGALHAFTQAEGTRLHHVKPHGALYNLAAADLDLALAIAQAVVDFDPKLVLYGLSGSELLVAGKQLGLTVASEVFADRTYQSDGSLTPRNQPNSLITEEKQAIEQVLSMILKGQVRATDGTRLAIHAESLCLHGDGKQALLFAQAIQQALLQSTIQIQPIQPTSSLST